MINVQSKNQKRFIWNKGKNLTKRHKENISKSRKGAPAWNKGKKWSDKIKKKIRDLDNNTLDENREIFIDLEKIFDFAKCFSNHIRFYYGHDPQNPNSMKFLGKTKYVFGENLVFTKPIQQVKH